MTRKFLLKFLFLLLLQFVVKNCFSEIIGNGSNVKSVFEGEDSKEFRSETPLETELIDAAWDENSTTVIEQDEETLTDETDLKNNNNVHSEKYSENVDFLHPGYEDKEELSEHSIALDEEAEPRVLVHAEIVTNDSFLSKYLLEDTSVPEQGLTECPESQLLIPTETGRADFIIGASLENGALNSDQEDLDNAQRDSMNDNEDMVDGDVINYGKYTSENNNGIEKSLTKNITSQVNIFEPTFATTDLTPTENLSVNIQNPSDGVKKISTDISLGSSVKNEENFPLKSNSGDLSNEDIQERIPSPDKLFGFKIAEDENDNKLIDSSKYSSSMQHNTVWQNNRHYKENIDESYLGMNSNYHRKEMTNKIESGTLFEHCSDCDIRILPIQPLEQRSTPTAEEELLPAATIKFADLPEGREIHINSLGLSDGLFLFRYISEFLSWIQPNDFPVELLKDALKSEISWTSLITQSLQVEVGFVACLVAGVMFVLAVPIVVLSHACYRMTGHTEDSSEDNSGWAGNCRRRTLVFILQILLVFLCAGMVAMFVTNEQLSTAVVQSNDVLQTALSDVSTFIHNSHLQLHFLLTQSLDQTLQTVFADLDNVDSLLGRPIQKELVRETGLDVALDSLSDMTKEAKSVTQQVERFLEEVRTTQELLSSSRDKLSDLRQQVELFRRACGPRDRVMCDTIDASGLEVTLRLDQLKMDERLNRMRRMGGVGLELAASEAKDHFLAIPSRVEADTKDAREDVRRLLTRQRKEVDEHTVALERLSRDLVSKVGEARYQAGYWTQDMDQLEYWRWIICMGGGAAVLMIWLMLLCSMCCGCCGSERAAGPTILVTIVLLCLFSTALWTLVMIGLLVGGHSEVFLCRPLYDEPEFDVLSRLVDQPGVFYDQPSGGFIGNVIYGNNTVDVPVRTVLQECKDSRPVYPALGLQRVMDVESAIGEAPWNEITSHLRAIRANLSQLEVMSPSLTGQLGDLLTTFSVNFTEHRIQMSKPVTGKDLDSFARQLDNIGNQLRDLATASRIETLSSRTRRLIESHIRPLEGRKDALVYQLTALEVQTQPLQRQVNQSLSHLKTIQFFINSQGEAIAQRKSREYVDRLLKYLDQLRHHVTSSAQERVAPCRPIWDIFNNSRLFLCRHIVDPLNGFWFATMVCLLILLVATPVCLKLVDYYRIQGSRSSGSPESLVTSEQGQGWSTPGYDIKCNKGQQ